ncbi:hypothetical protein Syun_000533 [Stephania yunnanensis]|uniref:Plastocyanin-like domain-containing protein n=1 Tax=Stephania yunnanensis TaxID=152371 RepID=A0AAP0LDC4_9MAGN
MRPIVVVLKYNESVQVVLQDTSVVGLESHHLHLHGFNFFVVGLGVGNYDPNSDMGKFDLIDPVERNTVGCRRVGVSRSGSWRIIQVSILICRDVVYALPPVHTSWGLKVAWVVMDGKGSDQKLPPPPSDFPKC